MIRDDITRALNNHNTTQGVDDYLWLMQNTPGVNLLPEEERAILERLRELEKDGQTI